MNYSKQPVICLIGLGYVGLPLATLFGKTGLKTYGYARTKSRIEELQQGWDRTNEVSKEELKETTIEFSNDPSIISKSNFIIVAVPTPVDEAHQPDLEPVESASKLVGKYLQKDSVVVFESTVYPGVTEEICIPLIEKESGLKCGTDWVIGYSPERVNPGDKDNTLDKIVKITSGMDAESGDYIDSVYKKIITAGTFLAPNIKTAEACKVFENTQRDINIAIMNELSIICEKLGINTFDVLEGAGTKWNFLKFKPGLVGGHCIGVDPYYLVYKSEMEGYTTQLISAARRINDGMATRCANSMVKMLIQQGKQVKGAKLLIMGATFKEDVKDNRNSKVTELITELKDFGVDVYLHDPWLTHDELGHEFDIDEKHYVENIKDFNDIDGICYAVNHAVFQPYTLSSLHKLSSKNPIFFDIKGRFLHDKDTSLFAYKSL